MSTQPLSYPTGELKIPVLRLVARAVILLTTVALILFGTAGRLDWLGGWLCLALLVVTVLINYTVMRAFNPELLVERFKKRSDTKPFDKVFALLFTISMLSLLVVAGLNVRLSWSPVAPGWRWLGVLLHGAGMVPLAASLAINRHLETTVRIQTDRHHEVVTSGPYRFVRHPMYTGMLLMFAGWPLVFGTAWAYVPYALFFVSLLIRTSLEDRTLQAELPGYREYAGKTRYRLVPGVW